MSAKLFGTPKANKECNEGSERPSFQMPLLGVWMWPLALRGADCEITWSEDVYYALLEALRMILEDLLPQTKAAREASRCQCRWASREGPGSP